MDPGGNGHINNNSKSETDPYVSEEMEVAPENDMAEDIFLHSPDENDFLPMGSDDSDDSSEDNNGLPTISIDMDQILSEGNSNSPALVLVDMSDSSSEGSNSLSLLGVDMDPNSPEEDNSNGPLQVEVNIIQNSVEDQMDEVDIDEEESTKDVDIYGDEFIDISPDQDCGVTKCSCSTFVSEETESPGYGDRVFAFYKSYVINPPHYPRLYTYAGEDQCHFTVGKGPVEALDIAVSSMKTGESAAFVCQPSYLFGAAGQPPVIPPNAPMFIQITLFSWNREDLSGKKDGGILRKSLVKPIGCASPNEGALVRVHIIGYYNDKTHDDRILEFCIGEGCRYDVPEGIEIALLKFRAGEKSKLFMASKYAFGSEGNKEKNIPPNADVEYDVTLLDFEKAKEIWDMNTDEKWNYAQEAKEKGTALFKGGHIKPAMKQYKRIVKYLEDEPGVATEEIQCRQELLLAGYLNIALCHLKLGNPMETVKMCDKALEISAFNEKALFRRGQARYEVNDFAEALKDFKEILKHYPENKAAKNYVTTCEIKIKEFKRKERAIYGNMFKKFAEEDEERRKQRQQQTETGIWGGQEHDGASASSHSTTDDDPIVQMLNKQNLCMPDDVNPLGNEA